MFGSNAKRPPINERFEEISVTIGAYGRHLVVKDKETGVLYYMIDGIGNSGGGLTPLLDSNGKVVIEA